MCYGIAIQFKKLTSANVTVWQLRHRLYLDYAWIFLVSAEGTTEGGNFSNPLWVKYFASFKQVRELGDCYPGFLQTAWTYDRLYTPNRHEIRTNGLGRDDDSPVLGRIFFLS
jgi:hypothetical protein